jgi:hypothetical protein
MPIHVRFKLAGIALTLGGLTAATCHVFSFESSAEVSQLTKYASLAEPVHLVLFLSLLLVLLGWSEQHSLQPSDSGLMGSASFVCLFLGIICGDLLHCTLEFSVFPVLGSMVPYALPGIADATYRSAAVNNLIWAGQALMFFGGVTTALSIRRSRFLPLWTAAPMIVSAVPLGLGLFPQFSPAIVPASMPAFYVSIAVLGVSIFCARRASRGTLALAEAAAK